MRVERLRASARKRMANEVVVARGGVEALELLVANSDIQKPVDFISSMEAIGQLGLHRLVLNHPAPTRDS